MICGKRIFESQIEAMQFISVLKMRRLSSKIPSKVYRCNDCDGFHITTEGKRPRYKVKTIEPESAIINCKRRKELIVVAPLKFKVK